VKEVEGRFGRTKCMVGGEEGQEVGRVGEEDSSSGGRGLLARKETGLRA
jgi:hypothetical protein